MSDTEDAAALKRARRWIRLWLEARLRFERDADSLRFLRAESRVVSLTPATKWLADEANRPALHAIWDEERRRVGLPPEFAAVDASAETPTPQPS